MPEPSIIRPPHRPDDLPSLGEAVLILIDAQNTYTRGPLRLQGIEPAIAHAAELLERARAAGSTVIHVQHDAGEGSLFDLGGESGRIVAPLAPRDGEAVVTKTRPNSFYGTELEQLLDKGPKELVLAGFMSHMCVNSTARAAFDLDFVPTVVAAATATRDLPGVTGTVPAAAVQAASLASLGDAFAVVVPSHDELPG